MKNRYLKQKILASYWVYKISNKLSETLKKMRYILTYLTDSLGRQQETNMLTERGLYKMLFISRKDIAKHFQNWVFGVIEEIRKTGQYKTQKRIENECKSNTLIATHLNKSIAYIGVVKEIVDGECKFKINVGNICGNNDVENI